MNFVRSNIKTSKNMKTKKKNCNLAKNSYNS